MHIRRTAEPPDQLVVRTTHIDLPVCCTKEEQAYRPRQPLGGVPNCIVPPCAVIRCRLITNCYLIADFGSSSKVVSDSKTVLRLLVQKRTKFGRCQRRTLCEEKGRGTSAITLLNNEA